jgi:hypothetical protein
MANRTESQLSRPIRTPASIVIRAAERRAGGPVVQAGMIGGGGGALIGALLLGPIGAVIGSGLGAALATSSVEE